MRILLVSEFFPDEELRFSGGVEARNYFIAKYLSQHHHVTVLTSNIAEAPKGDFEVLSVGKKRKYSATVGSISERLNFIKEAIRVGSKIDADIVEGSNFITHFIAKKISKKKRIPVVAWYPDVWVGEWSKHAGIYAVTGEILERYNLSQKYDSFIAISNQTAQKLKKFISQKITVIPCGVDLKEFSGKSKKFPVTTLISIGRLTDYKNQQLIISAFNLVKKEIDAKLIIVGDGPNLKKLKEKVRHLGLGNDVKFYQTLPRKELVNLLRSSHIFVHASKVEGFGIATIEACAAGLPYVISDIPIHREVTRNGQGGFLVNPDSPEDFAEKIISLVKDQKLYQRKSQQALELSNKYDWQTIAHETEKVYHSLV